MALATNLGFPRIGRNRELKKATEGYWAGQVSREDLVNTVEKIRQDNWELQQRAGLDQIPIGDFSLYDHVLDTAFAFDVIPQRFRDLHLEDDLALYYGLARGSKEANFPPPLEMTKWFDTNYHYLVPEFDHQEDVHLERLGLVCAYRAAVQLGYPARPVVLSPFSFLFLGKSRIPGRDPLDLLDHLMPAYEELLACLTVAGAEWIQIEEPSLVLDLNPAQRKQLHDTMTRLARATPMNILLTTYFGRLGENLDCALHLPIDALHLDLVRAPEQLEDVLQRAPKDLTISLGLVSGRDIWKTDLAQAVSTAERAADALTSERIIISPSCSLLHVPVDLSFERALAPEIKDWMAFGEQKLDEVVMIKRAINEGREAVRAELDANRESLGRRRTSRLVVNSALRERMSHIAPSQLVRHDAYSSRRAEQESVLRLPLLPTTTIGSFPQTEGLRQQRTRWQKGEINRADYNESIRKEISHVIDEQEALGLDVLVHGEPERNDMVEYFGELLEGFAITENGWVQSYGTRCVKPPVLFGDIVRRSPMTVGWWKHAQSLTKRPVKGILSGPVTILQWSFVRDDQPRRDTCMQLALAIREEALDLDAAGCRIIQIDEPALREGLPLHKVDAAE